VLFLLLANAALAGESTDRNPEPRDNTLLDDHFRALALSVNLIKARRKPLTKHNVCSNSPLTARRGSTVTLENYTTNDVVVDDNGNSNTWPFSDKVSAFTITVTAGTEDVTLKTTPGTYH